MSDKKIVAVMPIKLNNERLPGKNTKLLGQKPLLQYELNTLMQIKDIADIFVYCSNESVIEFLPSGVKFLKRPSYLDLPTSNFTQIFARFMDSVDADIYVYAHATAPFVTVKTIEESIRAVVSREYDSAFCAIKIQDFLWRNNKPMNFDASNIPRSQDIVPVYRETSGVYVFSKEVFQNLKRRVGNRAFIKEVTYKESVDINNLEDFKLAEALLNVDL